MWIKRIGGRRSEEEQEKGGNDEQQQRREVEKKHRSKEKKVWQGRCKYESQDYHSGVAEELGIRGCNSVSLDE